MTLADWAVFLLGSMFGTLVTGLILLRINRQILEDWENESVSRLSQAKRQAYALGYEARARIEPIKWEVKR